MSGAEILLDRPPGGWGGLVTNHTLDLRFAAFEERADRKFDALEARMDRKFDAVLSEMRAGFAAVESQFVVERAERRTEVADLRTDMERRFRQQTLVMVSTFVALSGVMVAALRF